VKKNFKKLTLVILLLTTIIGTGVILCEYPDPMGTVVSVIQNV